MASDAKLDQIVKGVPPPNVSPTQIAESAKSLSLPSTRPSPQLPSTAITTPPAATPTIASDPRDSLPSSPPQIYLNLLILESSLRLQYLSLRARLRVNALLLAALLVWNFTFTYLLFFRPREDGSGVGGSVYWVLETAEKLGWCSGVVTLCLFWATGMYERGVRWPRKFLSTTNRGLRGFNMKVVVVKGGFLAEVLGWLAMLDPAGWFREERVQFQVLPRDIEAANAATTGSGKEHWNLHVARHGLVEEDIAPSGDVLKLLLLPKPFSPDFREGWETYRMEYWERENARRGELRKLYRARIREVARREGGWMWWTGWRGWKNFRLFYYAGRSRRQIELEKLALREKPAVPTDALREKKRNSSLLRHHDRAESAHSHSRSSSRSTTPDPEAHRQSKRAGEGPEKTERMRRGSSTGSQRRLKKSAVSRLSEMQDSEVPQPLSKRNSTLSTYSIESDELSIKKEEGAVEVKPEPAEA